MDTSQMEWEIKEQLSGTLDLKSVLRNVLCVKRHAMQDPMLWKIGSTQPSKEKESTYLHHQVQAILYLGHPNIPYKAICKLSNRKTF